MLNAISSVSMPALAACGCAVTLSTVLGYLWLGVALLVIMCVAVAIDLYFIWQRCAERRKRLAQLAARRGNRGNR